jgi:hypothetical protein
MFTDLDTSTVDPERATIFAVEFLVWWFQSGSAFYGNGRADQDEGLRLFAEDAVIVVGGWRAARRVLRSEARFSANRIEPDDANQCGAKQVPDGWSLECTRTRGHEGPHTAHGSDGGVLAIWHWTIPAPSTNALDPSAQPSGTPGPRA